MSASANYFLQGITMLACAVLPANELDTIVPGASHYCSSTTAHEHNGGSSSAVTPASSGIAAPSPMSHEHNHGSTGHSHGSGVVTAVGSTEEEPAPPTHGPAVVMPIFPDDSPEAETVREIVLDDEETTLVVALTSSPTGSPTTGTTDDETTPSVASMVTSPMGSPEATIGRDIVVDDDEETTLALTSSPTGSPVTAMPSLAPSTGVPSGAPSGLPSDVPSGVPSDAPSGVPSDSPSMFPVVVMKPTVPLQLGDSSLTATAVDSLSVALGFTPDTPLESDFPSSVPSGMPVPSVVAGAQLVFSAEEDVVSSDVPSDTPSVIGGGLSDFPSLMPSDAPSIVPAGWSEGDSLARDTVVFMSAAEIADFEDVCAKEFLMHFLPWVDMAKCTDIVCKVVSQKESTGERRELEESTEVEYTLGGIDILIDVTCENELPADADFDGSVQEAFQHFGDEFEEDLKARSGFFEFNPIQSNSQAGGGRSKSKRIKNFAIAGGALMAGAVVALSVSLLLLREARREGDDDDSVLPTHMAGDRALQTDKMGFGGGHDSFEEGMLPPTPVGLDTRRPPPLDIPVAGSKLIAKVDVADDASESGTKSEPSLNKIGGSSIESSKSHDGIFNGTSKGAKNFVSNLFVNKYYFSPRRSEPTGSADSPISQIEVLSPSEDSSQYSQNNKSPTAISVKSTGTNTLGNPTEDPLCDFFPQNSLSPSSRNSQNPLSAESTPRSNKVSFKLDADDDQKQQRSPLVTPGRETMEEQIQSLDTESDDESIPSSPRSRWFDGLFNKEKARKSRLQDQHDYESDEDEVDIGKQTRVAELSEWKHHPVDAAKVLTDLDQLVKKSDASTPKQDNTASNKPYWG